MTAEQVRALREHLGLTQAQLAGRLGITQSAVSQIESGAVSVSRRTEKQLRALRKPRKQKRRAS